MTIYRFSDMTIKRNVTYKLMNNIYKYVFSDVSDGSDVSQGYKGKQRNPGDYDGPLFAHPPTYQKIRHIRHFSGFLFSNQRFVSDVCDLSKRHRNVITDQAAL